MNVGPMGMIGSLAGSLPQARTADADRTQTESAHDARERQAARNAEGASGVSETEEESETTDRDADGRRIWEQAEEESQDAAGSPRGRSFVNRDPHGQRGDQLDLIG